MRIGLEAALGRGDAHHLQHFQRTRHPLLFALAFMPHHGFRDLAADRVDRIERPRRPSTFTVPEICVRFFGSSRISARKVTLLPEPDSPSRPSTSPSPSESEM